MSINKQQQRAIDRVLRYYQQHVVRDQPYELTHEISEGPWHISLVVRATRTDCEPASPRAIFCNDGGHFMIGKRGRIQVCSSYNLRPREYRDSDLMHLAYMMQASVSFNGRRVTYEQTKAASEKAAVAHAAAEKAKQEAEANDNTLARNAPRVLGGFTETSS